MIRHLCFALAFCAAGQAMALESQLPPVILEAASTMTHLYPDEVRLVEVGFDIPPRARFRSRADRAELFLPDHCPERTCAERPGPGDRITS